MAIGLLRQQLASSVRVHGMMTRGRGYRKYEPDFPPFVALAEEQTFDNPIVQLHDYLGQFAQSYLDSGQPAITTP